MGGIEGGNNGGREGGRKGGKEGGSFSFAFIRVALYRNLNGYYSTFITSSHFFARFLDLSLSLLASLRLPLSL